MVEFPSIVHLVGGPFDKASATTGQFGPYLCLVYVKNETGMRAVAKYKLRFNHNESRWYADFCEPWWVRVWRAITTP